MYYRSITTRGVRIVIAFDRTVVVFLGYNNTEIHPSRPPVGVVTAEFIEVCACVTTFDRVVQTFDIEETLSFTPKFYALLEDDLLNNSIFVRE